MKTQVLNLETYDDRHSILDRLNWGQADRVILIWPLRGAPLENKLDLKIIHRRCQSSNMKLALVTKKKHIQNLAHQLGIPVFPSLRQAQRIAWEYTITPPAPVEKPERKYTREQLRSLLDTDKTSHTKKRLIRVISVVASLLSLFALAAYFLPGAKIVYSPQIETQSLPLAITASPQFSSFNLSGAVPAERLLITVEGRATRTPSGETAIPDQTAAGLIQFTNLTDQEITIPAGTIIRTSDPNTSIRFLTSTQSTLLGQSGATITIPIEAANPGSASNLPTGALTVIEGELSRSLTATNPDPTSGGSEQLNASPTAADYDILSEQLLSSLWETALQEAEELGNGQGIILDSAPRNIKIIEETFAPPEPQPSATLELILRVEYEILAVQWEDLKNMGNAILDTTLPEGYLAQEETFSYQVTSPPQIQEDETASFEVEFQRSIFPSSGLAQTITKTYGRTPATAAQILEEEMQLQQPPSITIWPEWWPLMPFSSFRMTIQDTIQSE